MSAKIRSPWVDYVVYLAIRIGVCVVEALPFELACRFAEVLAWLAYHLDTRHRLPAHDNLRNAFPGKHSDADIDAIVRNVYRHFCTMLIEMIHMPRRYHLHNYKQHTVLREPH